MISIIRSQKEELLIRDDGAIVLNDGCICDWFDEIISSTKINQLVFYIASRNRVMYTHEYPEIVHYALKPFGRTVLNELKDNGFDVISVGKINDIFDGEGVTEAHKSKSSVHGMEQTLEIAKKDFNGLCFVNLVDFDALWGHRRNPQGYAQELEKFAI